MTSGTYSPAEYEFMLRKYQSDLSVAKKTISTLQSELATARLNAKCPCCENGVTVEGLQCPECKGKGLAVIAYEHTRYECKKLTESLATARESEKHSIEFIQRDNDIRNEALESAALWFENPLNGYAMNGSIIAEHIRSLKLQPLNTNIASAPEGSGA